MPLYYFECGSCRLQVKRLLSPDEAESQKCKCGSLLNRTPKGPSTSVKERLDNGLMPKAIERYSEAERLYAERAAADPKLQR